MSSWVAVDKDGREWVYDGLPHRSSSFWYVGGNALCINLPIGSIKKLIGYKLTWANEPVEIK